MKKLILFVSFLFISFCINAQYVETTHEGGFWSINPNLASPSTPAFAPTSGEGVRLMWIPSNGSFRVGGVNNSNWDADKIGQYSFAAGFNTLASKAISFAFGSSAKATGNYSTSIGRLSTASGETSIAFGFNSNASGKVSTAMGSETKAIGDYSTALGNKSQATNESSFAAGNEAKATGVNSVAMGSNANAKGTNSVAIGGGTNANNLGSVALGYLTSSSATGSTALGWGSKATGPGSTAMGRETTAGGEQSFATGYKAEANGKYSFAAGNSAFATGEGAIAMGFEAGASGFNGTALGYRSEAIGSMSVALSLGRATGSNSYALGYATLASGKESTAMGNLTNTNNKEGSFVIGDKWTGATDLLATTDNQYSARFRGGYRLYTSADLTTYAFLNPNQSSWGVVSDSTKKENFIAADLEKVLNSVSKMRIGTWNYKKQDPAKYRHWGVMAQDFYKHFGQDEMGTIGDETSIATADFDGVSFAAIKGLEQRTRDLKAENESLKNINKELALRIEQLQTSNYELGLADKENQTKFASLQHQLDELKQLIFNNQVSRSDE